MSYASYPSVIVAGRPTAQNSWVGSLEIRVGESLFGVGRVGKGISSRSRKCRFSIHSSSRPESMMPRSLGAVRDQAFSGAATGHNDDHVEAGAPRHGMSDSTDSIVAETILAAQWSK